MTTSWTYHTYLYVLPLFDTFNCVTPFAVTSLNGTLSYRSSTFSCWCRWFMHLWYWVGGGRVVRSIVLSRFIFRGPPLLLYSALDMHVIYSLDMHGILFGTFASHVLWARTRMTPETLTARIVLEIMWAGCFWVTKILKLQLVSEQLPPHGTINRHFIRYEKHLGTPNSS